MKTAFAQELVFILFLSRLREGSLILFPYLDKKSLYLIMGSQESAKSVSSTQEGDQLCER